MLKERLLVDWANTGFGTVVGIFGDIMRSLKLTMGNTEKFVRSISLTCTPGETKNAITFTPF